ncbi:MAG: N-acetylmuramoyl-L-alanine amidase [Anaerolineae bacterium]|nr:N-acetylmuramoyl-L-alanine amidase [Anaerolineae bacterium]
MSDETRTPTPADDLPRPAPDESAPPQREGETTPEWLQRIRAKREAEAAARRASAPAPDPAPPPAFDAVPAPEIVPGWLRAAPDTPEGAEAAPETAAEAASEEAADASTDAAVSTGAAPDSVPETPALDPTAEAPDWLKEAVAAKADAAAVAAASVALAATAATAAAAAAAATDAAASADAAGPVVAAGPAEDDEEARRQAAREARERRRRERRTQARQGSPLTNALKSTIVVVAAAILIATIFTFWTPASFLSDETREGLRPAYATLSAQSPPTPVPTPVWMRRIGIVSGHWGPHPTTGRDDPGAVCPDGFTETEVNRAVAQRVVQLMSGRGYDVDLLDEWDARLDGYQGSVLISIHADSCFEFDQPGATGFKVAPPAARTSARADDLRLQECLIREYGAITGLPLHPSLTRDMTEYHSFREIANVTPASIIELGFLFEDRDILENRPDLLAEGIVAGLLCFLENAPPTPLPELTPWPTLEATPTPLDTPGLS